MDIGIDLGTTYSVIAVNGRATLAADYPEGIHLDECDVTVIPTPDGDPTFPSALWEDGDRPGSFLIGYEALMKADAGDAPVLFSKRKMGTAERIPLRDRTILAKDAAVEVLKYLKRCAEQALGGPVERAVVSHPAYFDRSQVEETREAAVAAGFDMSIPDQMVMEPVAAALAYTRSDGRDPLRILTYDLGGGTCDVTYLERRGGIIFMRAFDGDHLLGGYNFDRELVHWLRKRLAAKGRQIVFDEASPADRGRLARLLRLAESVKIQLAEAPDDDARIQVRAPDILVDTTGRRVPVLENITRREFTDLIASCLETTVTCCRQALAKAEVKPEELDEIILVGGSTYAPWVHEAIGRAFPGVKFALFRPDLCVGAGAAIHAAAVLPQSVRAEACRLTLDVPAKSVLDHTDVVGQVTGSPAGSLRATLHLPTGRRLGPEALNADGRFHFGEVELLDDGPSRFRLTIDDGEGRAVIEHDFEVLYAPGATDTTTVTTVLPKPLFLETLEGLVPLAPEGVCLPAKCEQVMIRDNSNPNISIRIFQEDYPIGAIRIEDIPPEGGRGSRVELEAVVTEKNQIQGRVRIVSPAGKPVKESDVRVTFDIPEVPEVVELRGEFEMLQAHAAAIVRGGDDEERRQAVLDRALPVMEKVEHLLEEQPLERQEVRAALKELARIVTPPADPMEPSKRQFVRKVADCREAIAKMRAQAEEALARQGGPAGEKQDGPAKGAAEQATSQLDSAVHRKARDDLRRAEHYGKWLAKVEAEALAAHDKRDKKAWAVVNDTVNGIRAQVQERPDLDPPAIVLKLVAAMSVDRELSQLIAAQRRLEAEGRLDDWLGEIGRLRRAVHEAREAVMAVDDDQPRDRVRAQLAVVLTQKLEPAKQDIARLGIDTHKQ